ncbi:Stem 28 kDa glycoprotein [Vitis vinifera]|uniref:Stem 28 kDa glycoprotein n=1 Tax=Vitis vinifera TaxID=29760 RepID=A0A438EWA1_VITVI|nr:Stem 28 kDa glycoprotein [Vitis vinifera]
MGGVLLGSSGHHVPGLSCLSWRLGVEAHNIIEWSTVPQACESYVGHYMLGHQYRKDSRAVVYEALTYAQSLKLAVDGKDIWVFDVDETSPSNLPYYAKHGFRVEAYNSTQFNNWVYEGKAPALPESLKLYKKLLSLGIKAVFITGRPEAKEMSQQPIYEMWDITLGRSSYSSKQILTLQDVFHWAY